MGRLSRVGLSGILTLAVALTACTSGADTDLSTSSGGASSNVKTPTTLLQQKSFRPDCSDFLSYTAAALADQYLRPQVFALGVADVAATPTAASAEGGAAAPTRVSDTPVQEDGVDEADIVKSDASGRFYLLRDSDLLVLRAYPPAGLSQRPVTQVKLAADRENFLAQDFFLDEVNHRLVVMGQTFDRERSQSVTIYFDLGNPDQPVETARHWLDGQGLEARRLGSRVHRVSRFDVPVPAWFYDANDALARQRQDYQQAQSRNDTTAADRISAAINREISRRVQQQGAAFFLPMSSTSGSTPQSLGCDRISHPDVSTATGLALIDSFDTNGSNRAISALVNNAFLVDASARNLYLAQTSSGWFFAPNQSDETVIYRLSVGTAGPALYQGLAKIDGYIPDRFALSEFEGHLRVASSELRSGTGRSERFTHLTVLKADGTGDMPVTGSVRDLAPGESLRGTRFLGSRGFLVTFRQVDPLFSFDLSNPNQPRLMSSLKIPGFSSYLAPVGNDYLLTVGRAGDEQQLNGQLAVQLFDVRNLGKVKLVASLSPQVGDSGYSYSAAEYDPHAFTYFSDRTDVATPGTLSLPLQSSSSEGRSFSGFLTVRVDPAAASPLVESGRIGHQDFAPASTGNVCDQPQPVPENGGGREPSAACLPPEASVQPRRSLFAQDSAGTYLFTVSNRGIKAHEAANPQTQLGSRAFE